MTSMSGMRRTREEPVRITTAAPDPSENLAGRQRRYVISMAIRTLCFVGAILVGEGWVRWVLVAGAVFLPYIAVILANLKPKRPGELDLPGTAYVPELTDGRHGRAR